MRRDVNEMDGHLNLNTALKTPDTTRGLHMDMRRVAWTVMVSAFLTFCVACAVATFGVQYFLFESTVPVESSIRVSRGSIGVSDANLVPQFEESTRLLSRGNVISTAGESQANITFRDVDQNNQVIASVTLKNNSQIELRQAERPRFEWGRSAYQVELEGYRGEFEVLIPENLDRRSLLTFRMPNQSVAHLVTSGRFLIGISGETISVESLAGQAALVLPDHENSHSIVSGQRGSWVAGASEVVLEPGPENLLANSTFTEPPVRVVDQTQSLPALDTWNCNNTRDDGPLGNYGSVFFDGRLTMHLSRGDGATARGATTCDQFFGPSAQVGKDVRGYEELVLRATFYIDSHSLDACGTDGSECPLMLRMDYLDADDEDPESIIWYYGFYARQDPQNEYPLICSSCLQDHREVSADTWYTYESGNLFEVFPEDRTPASILNVRFYASGHEYDVYVSELSLLAWPAEGVPDVETAQQPG